MISICRACSHTIYRHHAAIVPSHSLIVRSTIRNRLAGHPRRSVKLIVYPIRGGGAVSAASSRRRRFRYSHTACGLAFLSPPIRYGRRGDDVPGVSICGRYRWRRAAAFHIGGGLLFRYDPVLVRLRRSVLLIRSYDTRNGTGLICRPSSRCRR